MGVRRRTCRKLQGAAMAEKIKEKMAQLRQEAEVAVDRAEAAERRAKEVRGEGLT